MSAAAAGSFHRLKVPLIVLKILLSLALFAFVSLFFFDMKHGVLPDAVLAPIAVIIGARLLAHQPDMLVGNLVTGAVMAGLLGALYLLSRGQWLGLGDVKLAFVVGLLFGYPTAVSVTFIAVWVGALFGIALMLAKRANMKTALPSTNACSSLSPRVLRPNSFA